MENAQNFAAIISSMVLEPSFFDLFSCFPSLGFFTGLVTAWATDWGCRGTPRGLPGAFWGPRGPKKGVLGGGGEGGTPRLAFPIALRGILTYMPFKG